MTAITDRIPDAENCPQCGAPKSGWLEGNCPGCLIQLGVPGPPGKTGRDEAAAGRTGIAGSLGDYELLPHRVPEREGVQSRGDVHRWTYCTAGTHVSVRQPG